MKTNKIVFMFTLFSSMTLGVLLFVVSQKSRNVEYSIRTVDKLVESEKESLRVLNAEWHYLNRPDRLEKVLFENNLHQNAPRIGGGVLLLRQPVKKEIPTPVGKPVNVKSVLSEPVKVQEEDLKPLVSESEDDAFADLLERSAGGNGE